MSRFEPRLVASGVRGQPPGFFAQTVRIKLASPQAAQLSMSIFIGKSVEMHLPKGPD